MFHLLILFFKVCTVSVSTKSVITTETIPKNHPAYIKDQIARQSRLSRQIGKSDLSLSSKPLKKSGHGLSNIHKDAQGKTGQALFLAPDPVTSRKS